MMVAARTVSSACAGVMQCDMQMARRSRRQSVGDLWSAPASMKSNNSLINGGSLLSQDYGAYAQSLSNFITSVGQIGISLYAISMHEKRAERRCAMGSYVFGSLAMCTISS